MPRETLVPHLSEQRSLREQFQRAQTSCSCDRSTKNAFIDRLDQLSCVSHISKPANSIVRSTRTFRAMAQHASPVTCKTIQMPRILIFEVDRSVAVKAISGRDLP